MARSRHTQIVLVAAALFLIGADFGPQPGPPAPRLSIDGGGNPDNDLLVAGNRGDTLVFDRDKDFTATPAFFARIETLLIKAPGGIGVTLDGAAVLRMTGSGYADPTGPGFKPLPALRIEGASGNWVFLKRDSGIMPALDREAADNWVPLAGNGENGVPQGYDLYVHVTRGEDPTINANAYLIIERGLAVYLP